MERSWGEIVKELPIYKVAIVLLLFLNLTFLLKVDFAFDQDLGRHIKSGELIVKTGQVASVNQFSYTYPDFPFINHHWFFQVLMYWVDQTIGIDLFLVVKILILLTSTFLVLKIIPKEGEVLILPLGFVFIHVLRERVELRPEIFSFLFTSLILFILFRYSKKGLYLIPLIQLIWVNTHIYFALGLIIQGVFLAGTLFKRDFSKVRKLLIILFVSGLVTLINPNFTRGALYPFQIFGNYGYTIVENQNLFFLESIGFYNQNSIWVKMGIFIAATCVGLAIYKRKWNLSAFGILSLGVGLSLLNVRSFPYLFFLTLPASLLLFSQVRRSNFWVGLNILVAGVLLFECFGNLSNAEIRAGESAKEGVSFMLEKKLPQSIFNNFDIGSYITYRAYPEYQVFVDGRPEGYPKEFFKEVYIPMQESPEIFATQATKYEFKTVIFSVRDQTPWGQKFLSNMTKNDGWKPVYLDDFIVIFVRADQVAPLGLEPLLTR